MRNAFHAMNRRDALRALSAGALASRLLGAAVIDAEDLTDIDHLETSVPDAAKSAAFYAKVFGGPIWKNNQTPRRYVKLGASYIAIEQGRQPFGVDHFAAGITAFNIGNLHAELTRSGIAYKDYPSGRDLNVSDPDGIKLQLSADSTWSQLEGATASPEPNTDVTGPVFRATGIDHILLNVSDPEKSAAFYEKILGPVSQRNNNRIWFRIGISRVGLLKAPEGQRPGINHYAIAAAAFDYATATRRLQDLHAKVEKSEAAGSPEFRDPDGLLVQVVTATTG